MPTVPTYDGPQLRTQALRPVYQDTPDVSSGLVAAGRALSNVGQAFEQKAQRDAETEANDIDNKITAGWLEWNAKNRNTYQGENVGEYEVKAKEWWDKAKETYAASASPLAQSKIGIDLGRKRNHAMASVLGHIENEKTRFADDQAESSAQSTIEFGVDTGDTAGAAERVRKIVAEKGARKGWTTEMVQADQQRLLGTMHLLQITRMAEGNGTTMGDAAKARAYYEANKGEIPAQVQNRVEQVLKGEADNQFADQFAASVATKPLDEQLAEASKITDQQRKQKTTLAIKNNHALVAEADRQRESKAADDAWQMVGQGRKVPERVLSQMNGKSRVELQDYLTKRAEHLATGKVVKTDPAVLAKLLDQQASDPAKFAKEFRAEAYAFKLSGTDLEQLSKARATILNPKPDKDLVSFNNKVTARVEMMGATGERHAEKRGQFRMAAQKEFEAHFAANGKPPGPKEEDMILDRLMIPGKTWFGGDSETYGESVATGKSFVPKISSSDRSMIIQALQAEGVKAPTDAQIMARFKLAKGIK